MGGCLPKGVSAWRGCVCQGVGWVPGGCLPSGCTPPPVNRITDRCKNITFPQLRLQTVIRLSYGALDTGDLTIDCIP